MVHAGFRHESETSVGMWVTDRVIAGRDELVQVDLLVPDAVGGRPGQGKRVAFFATDVFLRMNGWKLGIDDAAAHAFLIELLEARTATYDRLLPWIRDALVRL